MNIPFMGIITMHKVDKIVTGEKEITMETNSGNLKIVSLIMKGILIRTNMDVKLIY